MNNSTLFIILSLLIILYLWIQYKKDFQEGFDVAEDPEVVDKLEKDLEEIKNTTPKMEALAEMTKFIRGYLEIVKTLNKKMDKVNKVSTSIKNSKWNIK